VARLPTPTPSRARGGSVTARDPEQAYRRGYQQGAFAVTAALKYQIDPALWQKLADFNGFIRRWRFRKRRSQQRPYRDLAPELIKRGIAQ
jgi:hypothetical protein